MKRESLKTPHWKIKTARRWFSQVYLIYDRPVLNYLNEHRVVILRAAVVHGEGTWAHELWYWSRFETNLAQMDLFRSAWVAVLIFGLIVLKNSGWKSKVRGNNPKFLSKPYRKLRIQTWGSIIRSLSVKVLSNPGIRTIHSQGYSPPVLTPASQRRYCHSHLLQTQPVFPVPKNPEKTWTR